MGCLVSDSLVQGMRLVWVAYFMIVSDSLFQA